MKLTFDIEPVAQGRPRFSSFGKHVRAYDPPPSAMFKGQLKQMVMPMLPTDFVPYDTAVKVDIAFFRQDKKRLSKAEKELKGKGKYRPVTRPDVDNYAKGVLDALSGIVYTDDNIIVDLHVSKHYSDEPRIEFEIEVI